MFHVAYEVKNALGADEFFMFDGTYDECVAYIKESKDDDFYVVNECGEVIS